MAAGKIAAGATGLINVKSAAVGEGLKQEDDPDSLKESSSWAQASMTEKSER